MVLFEIFTLAILFAAASGFAWAVWGVKDTLHPLVYLMPMAAFMYVYMPLSLYDETGALYYFSMEELALVQGYNLLCVVGLLAGCYLSSWRWRDHSLGDLSVMKMPIGKHHLRHVAYILGSLGFLAYAYQIINVGGLVAAYDSAYGGGWADSGYIRDATILVVPAIVFFYLSNPHPSTWTWKHKVIIALLSVPLLLHGILGARRGPTFLALATIVGGGYLASRRRPSPTLIVSGGAVVGLLLLALVSFRGQIFIGSDFLTSEGPGVGSIIEQALGNRSQANLENEFLYGTYVILNAREKEEFWWGRRYFTQIFVRPIPRSVWPNKYEDIGMGAIETNSGMLGREGRDAHTGVPRGSASGVAAGEFVEWGWAGAVAVFFFGWFYAYAWQTAVRRQGIWAVNYIALMALSIFLVTQSLMAVLFRYLMIIVPSILLWSWAIAKTKNEPKKNPKVLR